VLSAQDVLDTIGLRLVLDLVCVALAAEQAGGGRGCPEMERPAEHLIRLSGLAR
jgi:hypothetical protein